MDLRTWCTTISATARPSSACRFHPGRGFACRHKEVDSGASAWSRERSIFPASLGLIRRGMDDAHTTASNTDKNRYRRTSSEGRIQNWPASAAPRFGRTPAAVDSGAGFNPRWHGVAADVLHAHQSTWNQAVKGWNVPSVLTVAQSGGTSRFTACVIEPSPVATRRSRWTAGWHLDQDTWFWLKIRQKRRHFGSSSALLTYWKFVRRLGWSLPTYWKFVVTG